MNNITTIPSETTILNLLKQDIFATINCVRIGKIYRFYPETQTADIQLVDKAQTSTKLLDFPLLLNVPCFVIGNSNIYISCPIQEGDFCVLLFNDRDITNWYIQEDISAPATFRKHNISDGLAIVGIRNSLTAIKDFNNENIVLKNKDGSVSLSTSGNVSIGEELKTDINIVCPSITPENGASGSFLSKDDKTITVVNGIITEIK